jgi:hypothetical protein
VKVCVAIFALLTPAAAGAEASFLERPLILSSHAIQFDAGYEPLFEDTGANTAIVHRLLFGLEARVTDALEVGFSMAPRIAPNGGFDHFAIRTTYLAHQNVGVRLDTGLYDSVITGSPGFAAGVGLSLRIPLVPGRVAVVTGRFTGLPPIGPRFSPWPSFSFADDVLTLDVNGNARTGSVGFPVGILVQLTPSLATQLRAGYRHTFGGYASADYAPVGVDLLTSSGTTDFIISCETPRKLQAASTVYQGRILLQSRFP